MCKLLVVSLAGSVLALLVGGCKGKSVGVAHVAPPATPTIVKAELVGGVKQEPGPKGIGGVVTSSTIKDVRVTWQASDAGATYTIYWSTSPGVRKNSGTPVRHVQTPYVHKGLTAGTTYYYVVTSTVNGQESVESVEVNATPEMGTFAIPMSQLGF